MRKGIVIGAVAAASAAVGAVAMYKYFTRDVPHVDAEDFVRGKENPDDRPRCDVDDDDDDDFVVEDLDEESPAVATCTCL